MPLLDLLLAGGMNKALGLLQYASKGRTVDRLGSTVNAQVKRLMEKMPPAQGDTYSDYRNLMRRAATAHNGAVAMNIERKTLKWNQHAEDPLLKLRGHQGYAYRVAIVVDKNDGSTPTRIVTTFLSQTILSPDDIYGQAVKFYGAGGTDLITLETSPKIIRVKKTKRTTVEVTILSATRSGS